MRKVPVVFLLLLFIFSCKGFTIVSEETLKDWIKGPVKAIALPSEEKLLKSLKTDEERKRFIQVFWRRRDPNPETPENEFKQEFEKRVEYANLHFLERGLKGWETARGQIYIILGPPVEKRREMVITGKRPAILWYYQEPPPPFYNPLIFIDLKEKGVYYLLKNIPEVSGLVSPVDEAREEGEIIPGWYQPMIVKINEKRIINKNLNYDLPGQSVEGSFSEVLFPFSYRVTFEEDADGKTRVMVRVEIAYGHLIYYEEKGKLRSLLRLRCTLYSDEGLFFEKEETRSLSLTKEELLKRNKEPVRIDLSFASPPGHYRLEMLIIDERSGKESRGEVKLVIPALAI
jgi:GWxTD domain-containing protein